MNTKPEEVTNFIGKLSEVVSQELLSRFPTAMESVWKADHSRATAADTAAEALILEAVKQTFPNDSVLSEEKGLTEALTRQSSEASYLWVVDPLDGTANFFHKVPHFAVSIARCQRKPGEALQVLDAGVAFPAEKTVYLASRALQKAWSNGRQLPLIKPRKLKDGLVGCGLASSKEPFIFDRDLRIYAKIHEVAEGVRKKGASALDLAFVADGVFTAFWQRRLEPWDMAAASLLIEMVGGKLVNYPRAGQTAVGSTWKEKA